MSISFLIIFNTIRITIFSRREEVEIMKLVGATNAYVRAPFLLEGALYGIIGAFISFLLMIGTLYVFRAVLSGWTVISDTPELVYIQNNFFLILLLEIAIGVFIGTVSSTIAIRKHLKRCA
ncbi:FtsX-like permease family protein [bacterium]|nr:FtsX-like permease family protein [bacterium]